MTSARDWLLETLKIVIPTGVASWLAFLFGRRKSNADAETQEAEADAKRQKLYSETLDTLRQVREEAEKFYKLYREAENRHAELTVRVAEREARLIEANATLAARDSVIANLKTESARNLVETTGIRAEVNRIGEQFTAQLNRILERLDRIENQARTEA